MKAGTVLAITSVLSVDCSPKGKMNISAKPASTAPQRLSPAASKTIPLRFSDHVAQISHSEIRGHINNTAVIILHLEFSIFSRSTMAEIKIASKANQATTLPTLLIASYVKELDSKASINVNFEEVDALKVEDKASVELQLRNGVSTFGSEQANYKLVEAFPSIQRKNDSLVSSLQALLPYSCTEPLFRSKSGSIEQFHSIRLTSNPSKPHYSSSIHT